MATNESQRNPPLLYPYFSGCRTQAATQIRAKGFLKWGCEMFLWITR